MMDLDRSLILDNLGLLVVLVIGLAAFYMTYTGGLNNGMWVDEGRYGLMATAINQHPLEFSSPWHGVVENYPPVFPYLLAVSQAVLGWGPHAIYLVAPLMLFLTTLVVYLFGRELRDERTGVVAAGLTAFTPVLFFIAGRVLIGTTLTMLFTLSLALLYYAFTDRPYADHAAYALFPVVALAMLTKQPAYALGPIVVAYVLYREGLDVVRSPRDYWPLYISLGLAVLLVLPWFLRNMMTCGIPLCEIQKVINNVGGGATGWESTDPLYYVFNMTAVLGLPFGVLAYLVTAGSIASPLRAVEDWRSDRRLWAGAGLGVLALALLIIDPTLFLLSALLGIAVLQRTDEDMVLWLGIAFGLGIINLAGIKIPRYAVFTAPVFALLVGLYLSRLLDWATGLESVDASTVKAMGYVGVTLLVAGSAAMAAMNMAGAASGYQHLDDAGRWLGRNAPDATVLASSPRQLIYYSRNRVRAEIIPTNTTRMVSMIRSGRYDYLEVDLWEYTRRQQVAYVIRNMSRSSVLEPVKVYRQGRRPVVILYRVTAG